MASAKQVWADLPAQTRLTVVQGRISNLENQAYNLHLDELQNNPVDKDFKQRLVDQLTALKAERDSVQQEINDAAANAPAANPSTPAPDRAP